MVKLIEICYQSNYNGCSLSTDEQDFYEYDDGKYSSNAERACDKITTEAYAKCDEQDGSFYGNIETLEQYAIAAVKEEFGADVVVTFSVDRMST